MAFKEGTDFYYDNGLMVLTEDFLLKRGYCCGSGCRHCPYDKNMDQKKKVAVSWSGGKDSALALWHMLQNKDYLVNNLFTVIDKDLKRVGLHGVKEELIERQASAMGIPLVKLYLPSSDNYSEYDKLMSNYFDELKRNGITEVVYGDIFLEDLKAYRDEMLRKSGISGNYPIWQKGSGKLIREFIDRGFRTVICAADSEYFSPAMLGEIVDNNFINNLPLNVDPGGENGEFHTFVFDGPIFNLPVRFKKREVIKKSYQYTILDAEGREVQRQKTFFFQELD